MDAEVVCVPNWYRKFTMNFNAILETEIANINLEDLW